MRFLDFLVLLILLAFLFIGLYFLWYNLPDQTVDFTTFKGNISQNLPENSAQFYPNMRYVEKEISYKLSDKCSPKKTQDFEMATKILEQKTILSFYNSDKPQILISCENVSPKPDKEGHFVAGEGGPENIINASNFAIILNGTIAFYRPESCEKPQIAIHEILHALGFNHNNNTNSIMFPFTNCEQTVDQEIIDEINRIYSSESLPDLVIESLIANKSGPYLNLKAVISNIGLKEVKYSTLLIKSGDKEIDKIKIEELDFGAKRLLTIQNLRIQRHTTEITIEIITSLDEISKSNNIAVIELLPS
jgi:hypothetical protein